jgi:hypothetical protein
MSRVQLALTVSDLDATVEFHTKLFATEPAKLRPGYANFALAEPSPAARCAARPDPATQAPTPS